MSLRLAVLLEVGIPSIHLTQSIICFAATKQLINLAWRLTTDSNRTLSPLLYPPHSIALACTYLAALLLSFENTSIPESTHIGSRTNSEVAEFLGSHGSWEKQFQARIEDLQGIFCHLIN